MAMQRSDPAVFVAQVGPNTVFGDANPGYDQATAIRCFEAVGDIQVRLMPKSPGAALDTGQVVTLRNVQIGETISVRCSEVLALTGMTEVEAYFN